MKKWKQTKQPHANLETYNKGTKFEVIIGLYEAPLGNVFIRSWVDIAYFQFYHNGIDHREWLDGNKTKLQLARAAGKFYKECLQNESTK